MCSRAVCWRRRRGSRGNSRRRRRDSRAASARRRCETGRHAGGRAGSVARRTADCRSRRRTCCRADNERTHTHTHTHPFNGPLSGTTRVSRYQKGKTSLDFTDARDSEWQWHQLGPTDGQTDRQTDGSRHRTPNGDRSSIHVPGETGGWSLPGE